jgi:hypothetical protein
LGELGRKAIPGSHVLVFMIIGLFGVTPSKSE